MKILETCEFVYNVWKSGFAYNYIPDNNDKTT